jgi:hypothetical protein|tara:strand:- start:186 stop:434 length:249 start_codon:yes stop_codon:yes gene_type:complete
MGYYATNNLRKDKYMSKEIRAVIDTIQTADSMKAVKVALNLSEANQKSISKVMEVVSLMDKNLKLLTMRLIKLEKENESSSN